MIKIIECGHRSVKDPVFNISDGTRDFPWLVGIYRQNDNKLICSGSLLSDKIVLTGKDLEQTL